MRTPAAFLLSLALGSSLAANAQSKSDPAPTISESPEQSYKLTFIVRELVDGKPAGARSYSSLLADTRESESIRSGSRVPISSASQQEPQYLDVGANFDFRIAPPEHGAATEKNQLSLVIGAEISSIVKESAAPIIRQNRWRSTCLLTFGKPTLLFSSEDPTLDRTTQVELTVVRLPPTGAQ